MMFQAKYIQGIFSEEIKRIQIYHLVVILMNKAQAVLLKLLANELFDRKYTIPILSDEEWKSVMKESQQQAVVRIAFNSAVKSGLPDNIKTVWQAKSLSNLRNNIVIVHNHLILNEWLNKANIPYVVLKGCSSAYYYPDRYERSMEM